MTITAQPITNRPIAARPTGTPTTSPPTTSPPPDAATTGPRVRAMSYEPLPCEPWPAHPTAVTPTRPAAPRPDTGGELDEFEREDRLHEIAVAVLRLLLEVLDGHRPPGQLTEHLTRPALRHLRAAGLRGSGRSRLTSMRVCRPARHAAEVAAVYRLDGRARAVAARFERTGRGRDGWRCVALRLG
ncbi:MAG: Rv3235 family protein [Pseudonocardia sp.]